ncbi:MAG: aspartate carbamoyltransferase regulatory subunit [Clostridium sp.]
MLEITSIINGLVIDHIESGMGIKIFEYLNLSSVPNKVALIINAESKNLGKKDIIKIEECLELDYTVLGLLSPSITINEIRDGKIARKVMPELEAKVRDILSCNNSRCITSVENYIPHSFVLVDREKGTYRCEYCDHIMKLSEV